MGSYSEIALLKSTQKKQNAIQSPEIEDVHHVYFSPVLVQFIENLSSLLATSCCRTILLFGKSTIQAESSTWSLTSWRGE